MYFIKYLVVLICLFFTNNVLAQTYDWVIFEGDTAEETINGITKDSNENLIVVGSYTNGNAVIGGNTFITPITNGGGSFMAKFDVNQNLIWAIEPVVSATPVSGGINTNFRISKVITDPSNNIIIAGSFRGNLILNGGIPMNSITGTGSDYFYAKFDANGICLWARNGGSPTSSSFNSVYDIEIDDNENLIVMGGFQQNTNIEGLTPSNNGWTDYFIFKVNNMGVLQWLKTMGTPNHDADGAIDIDINGNVYFAGAFFGNTVDIFGTIYTSATPYNMMLAIKFDNNGNVIWVNKTSSGNTIGNEVRDLKVNSLGDVFISTSYLQTQSPIFSNGSSPLPIYTGGNRPYILKLDANGNYIKAHSFGSNTPSVGVFRAYLDFDDCGENLYLFGHGGTNTGTVIYFDTDSIITPSTSGTFGSFYYVAKYDPDLNSQWVVKQDSLVGSYSSGSFYVDASNKVVFAGSVSSSIGSSVLSKIFFGQNVYNTIGVRRDMVIAKLNLNSYIDTVLADPDTICTPQIVKIWVDSAYVLGGSQVVWYKDTCCFNSVYAYGDTIQPFIDTTTHFYVRIEGPCDTSEYKKITIVFLDSAIQNITFFDSICPGSSIVLDATLPNSTYLWNTGQTTSEITVDSIGVYTVTVSFLSCQKTDTFHVANYILPEAQKVDTVVCPGSAVFLDASKSGALSYFWNNGFITSGINALNPGQYWCDISINGCVVRDSFELTEYVIPDGVVVSAELCPDQLLLLYATPPPPATYIWQDGSTQQYFTVDLDGIYWVDVTINGCVKRDTFLVSHKPVPPGILVDTVLCLGSNIILYASDQTAPVYNWSTGQNNASITVYDSGTYIVSYVLAGCVITDSFLVDYILKPNIYNRIICGENTTILTENYTDAQYLWSNGSTASSIQVSTEGIYWVDITLNNCSVRDSFLVSKQNTVHQRIDTTICPFTTLQLNATNPNAFHVWNDNSSSSNIQVNSAGIYWVDNLILGCYSRDSFFVKNDFSVGKLFKDTSLCGDEKLTLDISNLSLTQYYWQDGSANNTYTINQPGVYWLNYTTDCGNYYDSLLVDFKNCLCDVYIPNSFTANSDGINDVFGVVSVCFFETFKFQVFNRWGDELFSTDKPDNPWDGTFKNKSCAQGVYSWKLTYSYKKAIDSDEVVKFGKVILLDPLK